MTPRVRSATFAPGPLSAPHYGSDLPRNLRQACDQSSRTRLAPERCGPSFIRACDSNTYSATLSISGFARLRALRQSPAILVILLLSFGLAASFSSPAQANPCPGSTSQGGHCYSYINWETFGYDSVHGLNALIYPQTSTVPDQVNDFVTNETWLITDPNYASWVEGGLTTGQLRKFENGGSSPTPVYFTAAHLATGNYVENTFFTGPALNTNFQMDIHGTGGGYYLATVDNQFGVSYGNQNVATKVQGGIEETNNNISSAGYIYSLAYYDQNNQIAQLYGMPAPWGPDYEPGGDPNFQINSVSTSELCGAVHYGNRTFASEYERFVTTSVYGGSTC